MSRQLSLSSLYGSEKDRAQKNQGKLPPLPEVPEKKAICCFKTTRTSMLHNSSILVRRCHVCLLHKVVKLALSCNYSNNVRKSFLRACYSKHSAAVTTAINHEKKKQQKKNQMF